jgi:thioredoxin-related protein
MKKLLIGTIGILLLLGIYAFNSKSEVTTTSESSEIKWLSLEDAMKAAAKSKKGVFIDMYTEWCGPCKMLDRNTFSDKSVIDHINANYHAVKFNAEGNQEVTFNGKKYSNPNYRPTTGRNSAHEFTAFLQVRGYPTMYILNPKGEVQINIVGYRNPEQLLTELKGK